MITGLVLGRSCHLPKMAHADMLPLEARARVLGDGEFDSVELHIACSLRHVWRIRGLFIWTPWQRRHTGDVSSIGQIGVI